MKQARVFPIRRARSVCKLPPIFQPPEVRRPFCNAPEMGERVFLVAAIAIGIILPVAGVLYAIWMLMR